MAYVPGNLALMFSNMDGFATYYRYDSTDTPAVVGAEGYFNNADDSLNIGVGDIILCVQWNTAVRTGTIASFTYAIVTSVIDLDAAIGAGNITKTEALFQDGEIGSVAPFSLRFEDGDTANLSRTFSAGNRDTWTFSVWVKRSNVGSQAIPSVTTVAMFSGGADADNLTLIRWGPTDNHLYVHFDATVATDLVARGVTDASALHRATDGWIHEVWAVDTTEATEANRVRLYINGVEATINAGNYPAQNVDTDINSAVAHFIGRHAASSSYMDGYLSDIHFVDGQQLEASDFGEFNDDNVWVPKLYAGTYGTNGFRLDFDDVDDLGKDVSGQGNDWTLNNIVATDQVLDHPTNNWSVINSLQSDVGKLFLEGALEATWGVGLGGFRSTLGARSGKYVFEVEVNVSALNDVVLIVNENVKHDEGMALSTVTHGKHYGYDADGSQWINGTQTAGFGAVWDVGDIIRCEFNIDDGEVEFFVNDVSQGKLTITEAAGTEAWFGAVWNDGGTNKGCRMEFGQIAFNDTPTPGFLPLNTKNLAACAVTDPSLFYATLNYTGTGAAANLTSLSFQPDLVIIKNRDTTDEWKVVDSVRGVELELSTDSTNTEATDSNGLTAFLPTGFSLGTGAAGYNDSGEDFTALCLKEDSGFFDIVTYTGDGTSPRNISHTLGAVPEVMIVKARSPTARSWIVYHKDMSENAELDHMFLDLNSAFTQDSEIWGDTAPTSSVFTVGNDVSVNESAATYVAYLLASKTGLFYVTSYIGTGRVDGPFVWTAGRPVSVIIKGRAAATSWIQKDIGRNNGFNVVDFSLLMDVTSVEDTASSVPVDFTATGIKIRSTSAQINTDGVLYTVMAFLDQGIGGNMSPSLAQ